jgi:hypothetical protein
LVLSNNKKKRRKSKKETAWQRLAVLTVGLRVDLTPVVTKRRSTPALASGKAFFGRCSTTEHHQVELGVLMPKPPSGAVLVFVFIFF